MDIGKIDPPCDKSFVIIFNLVSAKSIGENVNHRDRIVCFKSNIVENRKEYAELPDF
jgi:hypothetical protein